MKLLRYFVVFVALLLGNSSFAQFFTGKIVKADSLKTPLYKATCKAITTKDSVSVQTYFDGTFKIPLKPFSFYKITASYVGYQDTSIEISTDGKGNSVVSNHVFSLRKDGMRLMGSINAFEDDVPINKVNLILKNIMTRQESRFTTGIDGYYNFKLDYEANYQLKVDKYSEGIMNVYQDTSFYISTIGFNLPLDFKFDIRLGKATGVVKPRSNGDVAATKVRTIDPVIAPTKKVDSPSVAVAVKTEIPPVVDKVVVQQTVPVEKELAVKEAVVANVAPSHAEKEHKHQSKHHSKEQVLAETKPKADTVVKVKMEAPVVASRESNDKKDVKRKKDNTPKELSDKLENTVKPSASVKKEHVAKAAKQLSAEDSIKLKEKIILDAQKELERQNQFALERQKREAYEASQREMMKYYESKAEGKIEDPIAVNKSIVKVIETKEVEAQKKVPTEQKYFNYSTKPGKTIIKGNVLDGANQLKLVGVNVSIRPLNSIFSAETQTDKMGYFEAEVDSGGMYIISFFKTDYKISKQFIDLSDKTTKEFTLQDVYLGENVNVDINRDMPAFFFFKNKTELTESVTEELNAIIVLMSKEQNYSIKLIGLAAADENFPKPLSTSRVQSIAQYLVSNGIKSEQIKFVALGDTKHRSNCGLSKPCTSEDYDKDRAVVYLITK